VKNGASSAQYTAYFTVVQDVEAVDPYTVKVTLNEICPDFLHLVTDDIPGSFITSKKAFDELGEEGFAKKAIGTGPFVFSETEWIPQQSSRYVSFKDYFKEAPKVNVKVTEIKDGSTALLALQNKEIDFLLSSQLEIVTQAEQSGAVVNFFKAPIMFALFFNGNVYEPFKDPKVREAIFHAIDRETNRKIVFGEYLARALPGVLPEVLEGFTMEGVKTYDYDPALSKKLLEEAGYANKIQFTALYQNNVRNERIFTLLQKNLADVGITMNLQAASTAEYYSASENRTVACSYASVAGLNLYLILSQNYQGAQLRNYTDYKGCDDLIAQIARTNDGPERNELYKQTQIKLSEDMPYFPHHAVNIIMVQQPKLHGIYSKGGNGGDVRFDKAYIE
jgi:ABC-type transport system substrate-binding protein